MQQICQVICLLLPILVYTTEPNTVIATINVGLNPAGIAITPNNQFAYVANNNENSVPGANTVSVLNLSNNTLALTITSTTFNQPYTVTLNAAGTKAYVTNSNYTTVSIIDVAANAVAGLITGFDGPSGFAITPDGQYAYVNNYGSPEGLSSGHGHTVNIVNLMNNTITGTINVDLAPAAIALTPNGQYLYVANYTNGDLGTGTVDVVDTTNNLVTTTILGFSGPFAIAITPDGSYAYVTNFGSNNFSPVGTTVNVIDLASNIVTATILVGIQPAGIAITPDGRFAYATNYNTIYNEPAYYNLLTAAQGTVNIIDITTNTVISPMIPVGQSPGNIAISPDGQYAYVSNYTSDNVAVIALPAAQISAQGCKTQNRFLNYIDYINKLTWTVAGSSLPDSYEIYRDAGLTNLAGTVFATAPLVFLDHNTNPNDSYTYYIVGNYNEGFTTVPVTVSVTQNC